MLEILFRRCTYLLYVSTADVYVNTIDIVDTVNTVRRYTDIKGRKKFMKCKNIIGQLGIGTKEYFNFLAYHHFSRRIGKGLALALREIENKLKTKPGRQEDKVYSTHYMKMNLNSLGN